MLRNCQVAMIIHFVKRLMCEVEFFWEVLRKVRCRFLHGANSHMSASNIQIADLERLNCQSAFNLLTTQPLQDSSVENTSQLVLRRLPCLSLHSQANVAQLLLGLVFGRVLQLIYHVEI